mgnify:CR=1 FL=1
MRTTVDLPDDLHAALKGIAAHTRRSLNQTVEDLLRRGLAPAGGTHDEGAGVAPRLSPATGLPLIRSARIVTAEDVRALEDE